MDASSDIVMSSTDGNVLTNMLGIILAFGIVAAVLAVILGFNC